MIKDKRLCAIVDLIPKCKTLADIGCDHGLTCLYSLKEGKAERVIATDVSSPSLAKARNLLCENGYEGVSDFRHGFGLDVLEDKEADVIVISGMGGREIVDIMSKKNIGGTYVLSPQSEVEEVRRWLVKNSFRLSVDSIVESAGKFYCLIRAEVGDDSYTDIEYTYGRDNVKNLSQDFIKWIDFELNRVQRIIKTSNSENTVEKFSKYKNELEKLKNKRL